MNYEEEMKEQDAYERPPSLSYINQRVADNISNTPNTLTNLEQVVRLMVTNLLLEWGLVVAEESIEIQITAKDVLENITASGDPEWLFFRDMREHIHNHFNTILVDKDESAITFQTDWSDPDYFRLRLEQTRGIDLYDRKAAAIIKRRNKTLPF